MPGSEFTDGHGKVDFISEGNIIAKVFENYLAVKQSCRLTCLMSNLTEQAFYTGIGTISPISPPYSHRINALAVIDEDDYPSASTLSISKADGIKWLTFLSGLKSNKAKRISKCNRGSVCINSPKYNITLVGTLEIITDREVKKEMWQEPLGNIYSGPDDPEYCVIRFTTERYNIFFDDGESSEGKL